MLIELHIRNVAVIESAMLPFGEGLNVLTGETGAGKSLVVGALSFLLGERAATDRIRVGSDRASVEGVFDISAVPGVAAALDELGIERDGALLVLKREVARTGRSRAWANHSPVTAGVLATLGAHLVSIHGQHDSRMLLDADVQREMIDEFANAGGEAAQVAACHRRLVELDAGIRNLEMQRVEAEKRADYLAFVVGEIDAARVVPGEDETLEPEILRLSHAEELEASAATALAALAGDTASANAALVAARRALHAIARVDSDAERFEQSLNEIGVQLDELVRDIEGYAAGIAVDPRRLRTLEERRDLLVSLMRKYGPALSDVIAFADASREQLSLVHDASTAIDQFRAQRGRAQRDFAESAAALTAKRAAAAKVLSQEVSSRLPSLGLPHGSMSVVLEPVDPPGVHGAEHVRLTAALNAGSPARPLDRIASGGELSRLMLALSTVVARTQRVPTLVFDEIDAGIGGNVAWDVGAHMRTVSTHHQVLAISHLAQIAAHAHRHLTVQKGTDDTISSADTAHVTGEPRVVEIARMLGGDADREVSRAHARELLARAAETQPTAPVDSERARKTQRRGKPV